MSGRSRASSAFPVTFRFRPPRASHIVDLRGELPHFFDFHPLRAVGGGLYELTLPLSPGVYGYKFFLAGDEWLADPLNPRTRSRDGKSNNVVVVAGTDEPVLHAPARPWVFLDDEGLLVVRAALRRGSGESLRLRWDEGDGERSAGLAQVAEEDEHLLFEARLPASARYVRYLFELEDGRLIGRPGGAATWLEVERSEVRPRAPEWWRDAVIYSIFVDRFRRRGGWGPPTPEKERSGGDLAGILDALGYLSELGVTALHLTPIHLSPSAHRYDAVDPRATDPALGGDDALQRLIEAAHGHGLKVICDLPVTHVHHDFFAFRDVRERGFASPFVRWFHVEAHPFGEGPEPGYRHYQKGQWREPLLRTDEPEVVEFLAESFARYARLGVDGFRVDAAADVPLATLERITAVTRAARPDVALFGEVVPENFQLYTREALDSATDFSHRNLLLDWLVHHKIDSTKYATLRARRRFDRGGPGYTSIAFTATHDQARFRSEAGSASVALLAELLTIFGASVPALYYGDEVGLTGGGGRRDFEDAWPDRARMPWPDRGEAVSAAWDAAHLETIRRALRVRRAHAAVRRGDELTMVPEPADGGSREGLLVLRRTLGEEIVDVCVNASSEPRSFTLPDGAPRGARSLFHSGACELADGAIRLGGQAVAVVARSMDADDAELWGRLRASSAELARGAFRSSAPEAGPLPSRLYVTVTERCNLRCEHCITFAPEKTARSTARTLAPWLIDALREPFATADYVGFVHGGESLLAPIFPEVLRTIRDAKRFAGAPAAQVHLLSNGMLLTPERAALVLELGVTSLSVSLDGATEATNDSLRRGGKLPVILRNLEQIVRLRAARGLDLRIGVSTVVTMGNAHELAVLGGMVRDLGIDWLKVEELFPCTPRARHELLSPRDTRVREAMSELRSTLAGSRVVLVDHLAPPGGCGCDAAGDPETLAFREADDFANRTVFQPCRMEWEQACVDPDGNVHAVSYDTPVLGSLAESSFLDVWNGETARALRRQALRRTRASTRRACTR
jgi:cyclomaltodextrinase / maltogenic alpha-amylase / neopullulanase